MNFNENKMNELIEQDVFIKFMYQDLKKRNKGSKNILEVVFNSEVLMGDTEMQDKYNSL